MADDVKRRHDLRGAIHQIIGYSELLQEEAEDRGAAFMTADLQKIVIAARRMLDLIEGTIPAAVTAARDEGTESTSVTEASDETGTILVTDDDPLNRDLLDRRLRAHGFTVETAESGQHALERLATGTYDVVLLDQLMPGLSGIDVLKRLRESESSADLPVIMVTALGESGAVIEALQAGANDYVTKPIDFPVVLARIRTQLRLKRAKDAVDHLAQSLEVRNRFIRSTFGRYLSDEVVASLLESPEGLRLGGEKRVVTIMMSDLRGFTSLSESLPPESVVRMLNNYLGAMAGVIQRHQGTIDEFIGDAILVIFGAPVQRPDDAARAVACAVEMQLAMQGVNEQNVREGLPSLEMGIGLNTGEVVVGNIGSEARAKYGVVGRNVNMTGRIESYTVGGEVLVTETTMAAAGNLVVGEPREVHAKGLREALLVYPLRGIGGDYDLWLPAFDFDLRELRDGLPVHYATIDGKDVTGARRSATLVRLSSTGAELQATETLPLFTNLQLTIDEDAHHVYAKVVPGRGSGTYVRFTSMPPAVAEAIRRLTQFPLE